MEMDVEAKRREEVATMREILAIYCRGKHHGCSGTLCPDCEALLAYALQRIEKCPRMKEKTFCAVCPIHCYGREERARIKEVMRYAGPRMMLRHPVMTLRHMFIQWRSGVGKE